jgi:hypothetical protein
MIVVGRLAALPQDQGVRSTDDLMLPVSADESASTGVPEGTPIPLSIRAALGRALAGPIETLVDAGVVPSSEVLARLVPQVAAATVAAAYPDEALQRLIAQNYLAFRNRRSLLLLNLEHQVRIDELPWVRALIGHRNSPGETHDEARAALQRLAELTIAGFPATVIPNPMVRELVALAREADLNVPFVEELAADIFMGTFSVKFLAAAKIAAQQLAGTVYERYYAIDYEGISHLRIQGGTKELRSPASEEFAVLCRQRSGYLENERWSVAANGTMIEQAQILTSQNLAALTGPVGLAARMHDQWPRLAERCFKRSEALAGRLTNNPRPLGTVKDAAYAWRQMIFYLSVADAQAREQFVAWSAGELDGAIPDVQERLRPALNGLVHVLCGGAFDDHGESPEGRRFLGWVVGPHWMLNTERLRRPS